MNIFRELLDDISESHVRLNSAILQLCKMNVNVKMKYLNRTTLLWHNIH